MIRQPKQIKSHALITIFVLILIVATNFTIPANAQVKYTTKSKKAIKKFESGLEHFHLQDYNLAINELNAAIKADAKFIEVYLLLSDIYNHLKNYEKEILAYKNALEINPDYHASTLYLLGKAELKSGKYKDARQHFLAFLDKKNIDSLYINEALFQIRKCDFAINAIDNQVEFSPVNLGPNINSKYDDYWPALTADEKILYITVLEPIDTNRTESRQDFREDFYVSEKVDSNWTKIKNIGEPMNTPFNEGAQSISADGNIMIFTACNRERGFGSCDLYYSRLNGEKWTQPKNIGRPISTGYWESQPSISSDGKTLYFASDRHGGKGNMDIWKSTLDPDSYWTEPVNLGDSINTQGNETSPFIHLDNKTLYFSSDFWIGMGGYDLFMSRSKGGNEWSTPMNLGYPINTSSDENGLIVNTKGNTALFASDRQEGSGLDIYQFYLYEDAQPYEVTYVQGNVYDGKTFKKLRAQFELIDLENKEIVVTGFSNQNTGKFLVCLQADRNYGLNVSKKGYLFFSENFSLKNFKSTIKPFLIDVPLYPINVGEKIILKNIFFETDSFALKSESFTELNKLVDFLSLNPEIKVELSGHTDNTGRETYNIELSGKRAKSVVDYLVRQSIAAERLLYKGYGFSMPIATNETKDGRAMNRRTELKIIE